MIDAPDAILLEQFAKNGSEEAFAEIVRRHIGLVHSVALRQTQNTQHAEEITQAVFIILSRKASSLGRKTILSGWLYHTARLTAANFQRAEFRRARREQEVFMQSPAHDEQLDSAWQELEPLLEEAMAKLGTSDRDAIVLRFFENKSLRELGTAMGLEERAAQKRVARGLEKLRAFFTKRGLVLSGSVIADAVSANSVKAASPALAASVKAVAFAKGSAAGASTLTLVKGALKVMAWTKAKTVIVAGAVVLLAAGAATTAVKDLQDRRTFAWRVSGITDYEKTNISQWPAQVWIEPAKNPKHANQALRDEQGRLMGINTTFAWLLGRTYEKNEWWFVFPTNLIYKPGQYGFPSGDDSGYDYLANLPQGSREALQQEINKTFGVTVRREIIETNVLVLRVGKDGAHGLTPSAKDSKRVEKTSFDTLIWTNYPLADTLNIFFENFFQKPIVDETGLVGNYNFAIQWDTDWWFNHRNDPDGLREKFSTQLGLELVPTNMPIEMLVVEKVEH